ncbi:MAG: ATP-dependent metallopeptidase FtsH/Yme1/Tma family protein, partial [Leptospira sp.]|nr:ATP-dependent metallopeptidase FtsH/Yme1/Tma family protein [Leptospira sp.]
MNKNVKNVILTLSIVLLILAFWYRGQAGLGEGRVVEITYSDFLNMLEPVDGKKPIGKIFTSEGKNKKQLSIEKDVIEGWFIPDKETKPKAFHTTVAPLTADLLAKLRKSNLTFQAKSN